MIAYKIRWAIKKKVKSILEFFNGLKKYMPFTPTYNRRFGIFNRGSLNGREPEIYNKYGERMRVFFLSDRGSAFNPYGLFGNKTPRHILWDRYNFGLKTHFYTHHEAFRLAGNPDRRFANLGESRAIIPLAYEKYLANKSYIENEFDSVFTFDSEILNTMSNAKFVPFGAGFWCGRNDIAKISPENYMHKDKNISIIASNKTMCPLHIVRQETARKCLRENLADAFGKFAGGGGGHRN